MKKLLLLGVIAALGASARADITEIESATFSGEITYDYATWQVVPNASDRAYPLGIYNNLDAPAAANAGISSTALTSIWGDDIVTTDTGMLNDVSFTVFNSPSSAGALLTATVAMDFYRTSDLSFIGSFVSAPISFGAGLPPGFYSVVSITGLETELIDLDVTGLTVLQTVTSTTGPASRLGVVSFAPVVEGSSPGYMYIDSPTIGPAGYYNLGAGGVPPANPGYRIFVPEPTSLALLAFGGLVALRRRK